MIRLILGLLDAALFFNQGNPLIIKVVVQKPIQQFPDRLVDYL